MRQHLLDEGERLRAHREAVKALHHAGDHQQVAAGDDDTAADDATTADDETTDEDDAAEAGVSDAAAEGPPAT